MSSKTELRNFILENSDVLSETSKALADRAVKASKEKIGRIGADIQNKYKASKYKLSVPPKDEDAKKFNRAVNQGMNFMKQAKKRGQRVFESVREYILNISLNELSQEAIHAATRASKRKVFHARDKVLDRMLRIRVKEFDKTSDPSVKRFKKSCKTA